MIYIIAIFLLAVTYHTFSYSIHLIKKEKNMLAAIGTMAIAAISLVAPIIMFIYKY